MKKLRYSRRLIAAAAVLAGLGMGTIGMSTAFAASVPGPADELVQAIADKFHVSVSDVQAVFDEHRQKREADHEEREQQRLAHAIEDGVLTQEQADAIVAKRVELQDFLETVKDMDMAERREAIKTQHEEVKAWAEEQAIPLGFLLPHSFEKGQHRGPMHGKMINDEERGT